MKTTHCIPLDVEIEYDYHKAEPPSDCPGTPEWAEPLDIHILVGGKRFRVDADLYAALVTAYESEIQETCLLDYKDRMEAAEDDRYERIAEMRKERRYVCG